MKTPKEKPKRLGRPPEKRSDPAFQPATVWIRKATYQSVRERLFKEGRKEFSVLVEGLLQSWLKTPRTKGRS